MGVQTTDSGQRRADTVLDLIGNTPLIRLKKFEAGLNGVELYGKAEWFNPGGSVKDRPAANMVREGLRIGCASSGQDAARCHVGQHRHRVRDDRGRAGISRQALRAVQCDRRAQAPASCVRRRSDLHRSDGRIRRRDSRSAQAGRRRPGLIFLSRPIQQRRELARALRDDRARNPDADRRAHHAFCGRAWARAARSWAPAGACAKPTRRSS